MNEQDISAEESAINKAIAHLEAAESSEMTRDVSETVAMASAWAQVASAIGRYNKSVVTYALAEAGKVFAVNPSPENWAVFQAAVEEYTELD